MVVMVLEKVSVSLRGELTRWLIEIKTGVYIGDVNAMVRDRLWKKCIERRGAGSVFQAWSTNNEQGYSMRIEGETNRSIVDWEGVLLIHEATECLDAVQLKRISGKR